MNRLTLMRGSASALRVVSRILSIFFTIMNSGLAMNMKPKACRKPELDCKH